LVNLNSTTCFICWYLQIGNPLVEFNTDFNSRAEFFWSHGLISDSTYEIFTKVCNYSQIRRQHQGGTLTPICSGVNRLVSTEVSRYIDTYDVTLDVCLSSADQQAYVLNQLTQLVYALSILLGNVTNIGIFLKLNILLGLSSNIYQTGWFLSRRKLVPLINSAPLGETCLTVWSHSEWYHQVIHTPKLVTLWCH